MVFAVLPVTVKLVVVAGGVLKSSSHVGANIDRFFFQKSSTSNKVYSWWHAKFHWSSLNAKTKRAPSTKIFLKISANFFAKKVLPTSKQVYGLWHAMFYCKDRTPPRKVSKKSPQSSEKKLKIVVFKKTIQRYIKAHLIASLWLYRMN